MPRLTINDLAKIKEKQLASAKVGDGGYRAKVTVNMGTCASPLEPAP